jgi:oligopeptide/dipeptide ABC transporter ATP-binding protein
MQIYGHVRCIRNRIATAAVSLPNPRIKRPKRVLQGDLPSPISPPHGCHFHTRCPYAVERCRVEAPTLRDVKPGAAGSRAICVSRPPTSQ